MIRPLEFICVNYLLDNLNGENVFTILQLCIDCDIDLRLMDECKGFIRSNTDSVLKSEHFPSISHECLVVLLEQDSLNVAEVQLFEAV